ncbi:transcriptional regulator, HxlR family [Hymenobacter roseosalivarius DSM 11622]|uniref:Transcriptional regulator, HxlR family n=1 Tax=Hymenobacter roseosalivarius DSM 11622 TaxID=645990 RepID=A0A1W1UVM5_9BACT|nr:helix-turn-helix domain-containing protein [Hymenobacter roseosalivarius]SMB85086.1 transcriptional regulator, HxlR family [Hymenobacter roseosalivarius DSM 11622]
MSRITKQQQAEAEWQGTTPTNTLNLCPVRTTMNVLGGKWKLLILSYLLHGPRRYGELRRAIPEITEKMLIQELRELELDGILTRTVFQQVPPKVEYHLTQQGQLIQPLLDALRQWGSGYLQRSTSVIHEQKAL